MKTHNFTYLNIELIASVGRGLFNGNSAIVLIDLEITDRCGHRVPLAFVHLVVFVVETDVA